MSYEEFKEMYSNKSTDQLAYLFTRGELREEAEAALKDVLNERDVDASYFKHAEKVISIEQQEIKNSKFSLVRIVKKLVYRALIVFAILFCIMLFERVFS